MPSKITIIGNISSGKSTFAKKLSEKLGITAHYLDLILVKKDFAPVSEADFLVQQRELINKPQWIIEGVAYWSSVVERFKAADEIIFLDMPIELCKRRYHERMLNQKKAKNLFIPEGCDYEKMIEHAEVGIEWFDKELRPKIITLIDETHGPKKIILKDESAVQLHLGD